MILLPCAQRASKLNTYQDHLMDFLMLIPPPSAIWEDISMDFITKLPASNGQITYSLSFTWTKLRMSTAYHPQTGGQTEVLKRCIQQYLRAFVHYKPKPWEKFLHWVEWSYNTSSHSSTDLTRFQVVYGKPPINTSIHLRNFWQQSSRLYFGFTRRSSKIFNEKTYWRLNKRWSYLHI